MNNSQYTQPKKEREESPIELNGINFGINMKLEHPVCDSMGGNHISPLQELFPRENFASNVKEPTVKTTEKTDCFYLS